jgi:hypothetical protein
MLYYVISKYIMYSVSGENYYVNVIENFFYMFVEGLALYKVE